MCVGGAHLLKHAKLKAERSLSQDENSKISADGVLPPLGQYSNPSYGVRLPSCHPCAQRPEPLDVPFPQKTN